MMKNFFYLIIFVFTSLFILGNHANAVPLLDNPYFIPTDENNNVAKEIPFNLVHLRYTGKNVKKDTFLNGKLVTANNEFYTNVNDTLLIKNMGLYKKEPIDLRIIFFTSKNKIEITPNGSLKIKTNYSKGDVPLIRISVYKHNTTTVYPNLYVGFSQLIASGWGGYTVGHVFSYTNLYGIYLPKELGVILSNADVVQRDSGNLLLRYGKGDSSNPETVYPIFKNTATGFVLGSYWGGDVDALGSSTFFDPEYPSPIPIPYDATLIQSNEQETTDINEIDVKYSVTQVLANYNALWQYPTDNTFKIKTNFERTSLDNFPIEVVVKLADNTVVDQKYYSNKFEKNNHEITFSTFFLTEHKGETVYIEYHQHLDGKKINLMEFYNLSEKSFIFPYSSENEWKRQGNDFKQEELTMGQTKIKFDVELNANLLNGKKVIQNKSTDDYIPLDFISDLTSNIPNDSINASFTKKVIFKNRGEQELSITLKSALSNATKEIVLNVMVVEGRLHFTDIPSGISFPSITLGGKIEDYEVNSFNEGILAVLDDRLAQSAWSLTATLTENKGTNDFRDILYFRNEEGEVYNITNRSQNVVTNKELNSDKVIINYEKNKKIGLFIRINPLFVKKGVYEGIVTWSLVDAPN